jgi:hypothetical protein
MNDKEHKEFRSEFRHELASEWTVTTLKELFETRLTAMNDAVTSAFEASEKAITKAESAQKEYNARSNEFRQALDDQNKTMLPRSEAEARFKELRNLLDGQSGLVEELRRGAAGISGGTLESRTARQQSNWLIALVVTTVLSLIGMFGTFAFMLFGKH